VSQSVADHLEVVDAMPPRGPFTPAEIDKRHKTVRHLLRSAIATLPPAEAAALLERVRAVVDASGEVV
jgi:hypothetical protein